MDWSQEIASRLYPADLRMLSSASDALRGALAPELVHRCRALWEGLVPVPAVRAHYAEILGVHEPAQLLERRGWLLAKSSATLHSQWREMAVARLMQCSEVDGTDLFCALKRAHLASQVPELAEQPGVICWMHVLGALEEQDPIQAKLLARDALGSLASSTTEANLVWMVQAAHFVDALPEFSCWMMAAAGQDAGALCPDAHTLVTWLEALLARLVEEPLFGRYGPPGDPYQVRPRHLRAALPTARAARAA